MISDELKQRILLKTGLKTITSGDCKLIAVEINKSINRYISPTTLKRVFGFAKTIHYFSKYTIITLQEYANLAQPVETSARGWPRHIVLLNQASYIPASNLFANMKILSFITEEESYSLLNDQAYLCPDQLVIEALEILLKHNLESLPIAEQGKCIGVIYTKDLIYFLSCDDKEYGLLFHKFNFDLRSVIFTLRRNQE